MLFSKMKVWISLFFTLALFGASEDITAKSVIEGDLPRRADLGFRFSADEQITVTKVISNSPAATAGLLKGDLITEINGKVLTDPLIAATALARALGEKSLQLKIIRDDENLTLRFTPPNKALEAIPRVDSYYDVVNISKAVRLRSIVAVPEGKRKALPTVFFVQWVSCGSLEYRPTSTSSQILASLVQEAGWALVRVDRSTSGDSTGPACHQLDYNTELEHYYQAFLQLKKHPLVDADNIILYGSSLGSTMAPLLAERLLDNGHKVGGVMVQGGGAVTYLERMLNFERIYLERHTNEQGHFLKAEDIHPEITQRSLFYTQYLIEGRHPDSIAKDSKAMARVRGQIRGLNQHEQYGRPFAWHQQAAQHNFLSAWQRIDAPILVVYNEFDQFEMRHGHKIIVDMVNRWRPGSATYIEQKNIGHSNYRYASAEAAYNYQNGTSEPTSISMHLVKWLKAFE